MSFLKRLFGGKKNIQVMRDAGDLVGLIAEIDNPGHQQQDAKGVWHVSSELTEALVGSGGMAINRLVASANECNQRSQAAVLAGDTISAGKLMNSRRFRMEIVGRISDPRTIRPLLDAFADGMEASHIPPAMNEMLSQQMWEMMRQASHPDSAMDSQYGQQHQQLAHMQGRMFALTMPAKCLAESMGEALIAKGSSVVEPIARALPHASPHLRFGLAVILEGIGGAEAQKVLQSLLHDPDADVRQKAHEALKHNHY